VAFAAAANSTAGGYDVGTGVAPRASINSALLLGRGWDAPAIVTANASILNQHVVCDLLELGSRVDRRGAEAASRR
jgi:hypothetical protein